MVRNVDGKDFRELDFITLPLRKYQVFEVLVVDVLRRWSSGVTWECTPVSGDAGIDFTGERDPVRLSVFGDIELRWKIVGQVKRMRTPKEETLLRAMAAVREFAKRNIVSGAMLVISADTSKERVDRLLAKDTVWHEFTGPRWYVPAERFLACFSADRDRLSRITANCYTTEEQELISSFLAGISARFDPEVTAVVKKPESGQSGRLIRCAISLRSLSPLPQTTFKLRYHSNPEEANPVELVRPSRLASDSGISISLAGPEQRDQVIWLRSFAPGQRRLGSLEVLDIDGRHCSSVELGQVEIRPFFEPPYFNLPNQVSERQAIPTIESALMGNVEAVVVTGAGGAGKSRFCERLIDLAADSNFESIAIRQENAHTNGRRMLSRLLSSLAVSLSDGPATADDIVSSLISIGQDRTSIIETTRAYLTDNPRLIDPNQIATALLSLAVERLRNSPLVIHLHDLHWAGAEAFTILGLFLEYLHRNQNSLPHGVLLMFEGRSRESLLDSETQTFRVPVEWFNFMKSGVFNEIRIQPWTKDECDRYLTSIFEVFIDRSRSIQASDLPLYDELIVHISNRARGNPMHLIEQLKRLYELGILQQRENGLLYVRSALPRDFETPRTVEDLIRARIDHYQRLDPGIVEFLAVLARIGRRVSRAQFRSLVQGAGMIGSLSLLEQMDVATVPRDETNFFEFGHENYFRVFRMVPLEKHSVPLKIAVLFYEQLGDLSIHQQAEFVRLISATEDQERSRILDLVLKGMQGSRQAEDDFLLEEFIRRFLGLDSSLQGTSGVEPLDARYELAEIMTRIGNWHDARRELETILDVTRDRHGIVWSYHSIRSKAELANVYVSLQDSDAAVNASNQGLALVNAVLSESGNLAPQLLAVREKLWHRKAVALWFDGRAKDAIRWQWYAYRSALQRGENNELSTILREIGTILFHRNPQYGIHLLERALEVGKSLPQFHHGSLFIIEAQRAMGQLLWVTDVNPLTSKVKEIQKDAERTYHRCMLQLCRYEAAIAALVSGAAASYIKELEEAHHWFRTATTISVQAGLEEEIWKSRLNLAQVAQEMGKDEEARVNAEEAAEVILRGLMAGDRRRRESRRSLMTLPLAHIVRIAGFSVISDPVETGIAQDPLPLIKAWSDRPGFRTRGQQQVLHVRRDNSDYFLMN
jgi:hypothetical protein